MNGSIEFNSLDSIHWIVLWSADSPRKFATHKKMENELLFSIQTFWTTKFIEDQVLQEPSDFKEQFDHPQFAGNSALIWLRQLLFVDKRLSVEERKSIWSWQFARSSICVWYVLHEASRIRYTPFYGEQAVVTNSYWLFNDDHW